MKKVCHPFLYLTFINLYSKFHKFVHIKLFSSLVLYTVNMNSMKLMARPDKIEGCAHMPLVFLSNVSIFVILAFPPVA